MLTCSCGKHSGSRLTSVRREYDDELHGVFYCEKGGRAILTVVLAQFLGHPLGTFHDGNGRAWTEKAD